MKDLVQKTIGRFHRLCLRPIRVFNFHQVSDAFNPDMMWECDWIQTDTFKRRILYLNKRYTFISLEEVYEHINSDRIRCKRYAALTADDGCYSILSVIPWLAEQEIPVTLFLNPSYMQGYLNPGREKERFLSSDDVKRLAVECAPYIKIASHGWIHKRSSTMTESEFDENIQKAESELSGFSGKIPFFALPFGSYSMLNLDQLRKNNLVPVLMDGMHNINDAICIHREMLII